MSTSGIHRLKSTAAGRKTLSRFRRFWGVKNPPAVHEVKTPGPGAMYLVGLGRCPHVNLADGPKRGHKRKWKQRKGGLLACNPQGTRLYVWRNRKSIPGKPVKYLGYCPMTEYVPSDRIEKAGSFKKGKHWQHQHDERGGVWPKVFEDRNGNIIYAAGTYRVGKWIER